jgi:general secretion pathway protein B
MSFVSDASEKSSPHSPTGASPYLSSELELYKKRFRVVMCVLAGVTALGSGYAAGYWVKSRNAEGVLQPQEFAQEPRKAAIVQHQPDANTEQRTPEHVNNTAASDVPQGALNKINTDAAQQTPAKHYQWLSVQVGMDQFGRPIYQQQLVPVSESGAVALTTPGQAMATQDSSTAKLHQTNHDASGEDIATLTAQGFKVVGKPLEASVSEVELNFDGVSPELKAAFKDAVQSTESNPSAEVITATNTSVRVTPINSLPERFKASIPPFKYLTHIYATEPSMRFIKINGRELYEGDSIGALRVIEITPEMTVFDFDGVEFSVEAMEDWPKG